jgi:hypothetical protein
MPMSQGDAAQLNTVLRWLLDQPGPNGQPITDDQLRRTAMSLAARVGERLPAGVTTHQIAEQWTHGAPPPVIRAALAARTGQ